MKNLIFEDISQYKYFMKDKEIKDFTKTKVILGLMPLLALLPMMLWKNYTYAIIIPPAMILCFKFPYLYLSLRHNQYCNDVIIAVPLWLNGIYALLEKNTIHNAIVNSLDDNTPIVIKKDLQQFVERINSNPEDKDAYVNFLKRYNIEGFSEIMLKLFEFRSLDKERLKEEFKYLNESLEKINQLKRAQRFKNEYNILDYIVAVLIIGIPCVYLLAVSMMPELYSSFM